MKIFTLLHKSTDKGTINIGRKSRITPFLPILATVLMLTFGVGNVLGVVTEQGSSLKQVTIKGTNYHVVMESTEEHEHQYGENSSVSRDNSAPAGSLFIQMRQASGDAWVDQKEKIQCSVDGKNYSDVATVNLKNKTSYEYYGPYTSNVTRATKYIRTKWDSGTKYRRYGNVYLTMASYCETITTEIDFGSDVHGAVEEETFTINWSNIADAEISITGTDASHYEIVEAKTSGNKYLGSAAGKYGYTTVTVRYKRDAVNTHNTATLSVHGVSVALKGTTVKRPNTITWAPDEVTKKNWEQSIVMTPTASNTDYANYPITLSSSNSSYASISGLTVTFHEAGADKTVTITASQATSSIYLAPVSVSRTFTIKKGQAIVWDEEVVNTFVRLNETRDIASYTYASPSGSRSITYGSADDDIISVDGTEITANAIGTVDIIATLEGDDDYNEVNSRMEFEVKNLATPVFTPDGFSEAETKALKVGESVTLVVSDVSAGLNGDFTATSDGEGTLHFTRVGNTITITAYEAGDVDAVFVQTENEDICGASKTYSFSVSKNAPTITVPGNQTLDVDGNYTASTLAYTNTSKLVPDSGATDHDFYYTINHSLSTSVNKSNVVITFDPKTKEIVAQNAGTATITIYQKSVREYSAESNSFTITVNKKVTSIVGTVSPMLVGETPTISSYATSNTYAATPSEGDSNDFYYTITNTTLHTPTVVTGCADGHDEDVIGYTPSTHTITAYNAGTAKLTIAQKETYKYTGDTLELNVTVSKHDPVFTWHAPEHYYYNSTVANIFTTTGTNDTTVRSDNPAVRVVDNTLYISPTFDETHITLTQAENYYWNYKDSVVTFTPEKQENHLPIASLVSSNASTYSVSMSGEAKWETKGGKSVMTFGDGTWWFTSERPDGYALFTFTGIPDTLKFKTFCTAVAGNYPAKEDYVFEVYESPDNSSWSLIWRCDNTSGFEGSENDNANRSLSLSPTTRYVKFHYKGSCWAHYSDIQVTEKYQFVANDGEKIFDFGSKGAKYGLQEERLIFDHANAGSMTRAELISGADAAKFTVSPTTITGTGRDKSGSCVLSVSFDNDDDTGRESSDYTAKLRIYDNRGNVDTVTLKGHRWGLTAPEFTWNQHYMPYYHNTTISNVVVSTNTDYENCPFTYESTDNDIAYVDEAGTLHIGEKSGSVTITVSQAEGNNYSSLEKTFTFTPLVAPSLKVPFYLNNTIYTSGSVAIADGTTGAWDSESANDIRLGDGSVTPSSWGTKVFVIAFSDAPDKVSFRYKTNSTKTSRGWNRLLDLLGAPMWTIEESATGGTWDTVWNETSNSDFWKYETVQLSPRTQYVRFTYNGNGNGYFGNIQVTALDGYHFMRTKDGKYLSRGGKYGTQAVLDEIGVAVRVTRYTLDNVHDTTLVQYVDSREYLFEDLDGGIGEVYTDNGSRTSMKWKQIRNADTLIVQSMNGSGKYITLVGDTLKMTGDSATATKWIPESATVRYNTVSTKLGTLAASAAFCEFGEGANTLERVRTEINQNDYDKIDIPIPHLNDKVYEANVSGEGREAAGMWKVYSDTIGGLIPGFYRLTVQAMYQTGADPNDWENNQLGVESQIAYVYANDGFYPVKSRYDIDGRNSGAYETGTSISKDARMTYFPDDATAAGEAFATASKYVNDVYAYVGEDSTLIYGIKNPSYVPGERLFYKNFTLTRIARKEYIYIATADEEWNKLSNWEYKGDTADAVPTINHKVTIQSDITIEGELAAYSLTIENGATVTIAPTGGLTVGAGGFVGSTSDKLILKASTAGKNGYLRVSPEYAGEMPNATVEYYCTSYYDQTKSGDNAATYQCVGAPITASGVRARDVYPAGTYLYTWNEATGAWVSSRAKLTFTPFQGFETTQRLNADGWQADYEGQLVSGRDVWNIDLSYTEGEGYNLLANSFAAPIAIENFDEDDFVNADQLIYILNAGTKKESHDNKGGEYDAPGKWLGIPINTAAELAKDGYPCMIPSMQGFWIKTTGASAQLKLDYSRLVWGVNYSGISEIKPLRTPKRAIRNEESSITGRLKVNLLSENENDFVYLLESERYSSTYENGYDARKMYSGDVNIFTIAEDEELSVDATNSIIGTRVGVRTGEETAYTLEFSRVSTENELALRDNETNEEIDIYEGMQYTFFAEPNSVITERFEIVEREAPSITTGVDNADTKVKVHKFIKDNQVLILKNGVLYNTMGAIVR